MPLISEGVKESFANLMHVLSSPMLDAWFHWSVLDPPSYLSAVDFFRKCFKWEWWLFCRVLPKIIILLFFVCVCVCVCVFPLSLLCVCLSLQSQEKRVRAAHKVSAEQRRHHPPPPYRPRGDETHQFPNSRYSSNTQDTHRGTQTTHYKIEPVYM